MEFSFVYDISSLQLIRSAQKILAPKRVDLSNVHTNEAVLHPRDSAHPERPFVMTIAENVLCWEHMKPYLEKFSKLHPDDNMWRLAC